MANETLLQLEQLRTDLQAATHRLGWADYRFDRWQFVNSEIAGEAYDEMGVERANIERFESEINALVAVMRAEQPALIGQWVRLHLQIVDEALTAFEQQKSVSKDERVRHRLQAAELKEKWVAVADGTAAYVLYGTTYFRDVLLTRPLQSLKDKLV